MNKIQIHGFAPSTYTQSALLAAAHVNAEVELLAIDFGKESHLALHPFAKMPILVDGDQQVFETLAIIAYLDTNYGSGALLPDASLAQVLEVCSAGIDYAYRDLVHPGEDASASTQRALDWLNERLGKTNCLATQDITAADLLIAPMLAYHRSKYLNGMPFAEHPRIESWLAEIAARPGFDTLSSEAA